MPYCAHCGKEISPMAAACPNCGHPTGNRPTTAPGDMPVAVGTYAGFWRRFLALLIDGIIVGIPASILFGPETEIVDGVTRVRSVNYFPGGAVSFLYHWLMISFNKGQTVGKMALGIRITSPDGRLVDVGRAAARQGMAIVSGLVLGLGFIWAAWDKEHRTWHDMVADTRAYRITRT